MMTRADIITDLYKSHFVEVDANKFIGHTERQYRDDIIAELYLMVCEIPERRLLELSQRCGCECVKNYVAGLVIKQLRSKNSRVFRKYTRHAAHNKPMEVLWVANEQNGN